MTKVRLIRGDATEAWSIEDNSLDSIVTDPPYGIAFMGKRWDDKGGPESYQAWTTEWAREAYRTLKPGGFLLAFGATRMSHRMAVGIEDARFKIVDTIEWLYLNGFPKGQDISKMFDKRSGAEREVDQRYITAPATALAKRWDGWKTPALKPAHEPIVVAQKPFNGTYIDNVEEWGVGAINVDGCRIPYVSDEDKAAARPQGRTTSKISGAIAARPDAGEGIKRQGFEFTQGDGRFPANVVTLDEDEWYSPYFNIVTPRELSKKAAPSEKKGD